MRAIRQRIAFLAAGGGAGLLAILLHLWGNEAIDKAYGDPLLLLAAVTTVLLVGFLIRECRNYKAAQLIVENKIIHIKTAQIEEDLILKQKTRPAGGIEVFISCFGILLDARVIKFNVDRISLKKVEIGRKLICLSYGTKVWTQRIRILHDTTDHEELQGYLERFRYETGVVPVIKDSI